jgi:hypothetical protein
MTVELSTTSNRTLLRFPGPNRRSAGFTVLLVVMALSAAGQTLGPGASKTAAAPPLSPQKPIRVAPREEQFWASFVRCSMMILL